MTYIKTLFNKLRKALFEKKYLLIHNPNAGFAGKTFRTRVKRETITSYVVDIPLRVFDFEWFEEKFVSKNDPRILEVFTRFRAI